MDKDKLCHENVHGCRLVSGGMVCTRECAWLALLEPPHFTEAMRLLAAIAEKSKKVA